MSNEDKNFGVFLVQLDDMLSEPHFIWFLKRDCPWERVLPGLTITSLSQI